MRRAQHLREKRIFYAQASEQRLQRTPPEPYGQIDKIWLYVDQVGTSRGGIAVLVLTDTTQTVQDFVERWEALRRVKARCDPRSRNDSLQDFPQKDGIPVVQVRAARLPQFPAGQTIDTGLRTAAAAPPPPPPPPPQTPQTPHVVVPKDSPLGFVKEQLRDHVQLYELIREHGLSPDILSILQKPRPQLDPAFEAPEWGAWDVIRWRLEQLYRMTNPEDSEAEELGQHIRQLAEHFIKLETELSSTESEPEAGLLEV
jgi:hypothetical protein